VRERHLCVMCTNVAKWLHALLRLYEALVIGMVTDNQQLLRKHQPACYVQATIHSQQCLENPGSEQLGPTVTRWAGGCQCSIDRSVRYQYANLHMNLALKLSGRVELVHAHFVVLGNTCHRTYCLHDVGRWRCCAGSGRTRKPLVVWVPPLKQQRKQGAPTGGCKTAYWSRLCANGHARLMYALPQHASIACVRHF
jgi:hypothetical protein